MDNIGKRKVDVRCNIWPFADIHLGGQEEGTVGKALELLTVSTLALCSAASAQARVANGLPVGTTTATVTATPIGTATTTAAPLSVV